MTLYEYMRTLSHEKQLVIANEASIKNGCGVVDVTKCDDLIGLTGEMVYEYGKSRAGDILDYDSVAEYWDAIDEEADIFESQLLEEFGPEYWDES